MAIPITSTYFQGGTTNINIDQYPDTCPRCHKSVNPIVRAVYFPRNEGEGPPSLLDVAFQCTSGTCGRLFIAEYGVTTSSFSYFDFVRAVPETFEAPLFSEEVGNISSNFVEIYNQALEAQVLGLNHLAGMGFGKSLEFLVKDFLITEHPEKEEEIKGMFLGKCIKEYIADVSVKSIASRAAWLRNDETHYVRRWTNHDVEDLKVLVRLVVNAIENVELAKKYQTAMNSE